MAPQSCTVKNFLHLRPQVGCSLVLLDAEEITQVRWATAVTEIDRGEATGQATIVVDELIPVRYCGVFEVLQVLF